MRKHWLNLVASLAALCAASAGAQAEDAVKIGAVYSLTGPVAVAGQDAKRGTELAVEQINEAGGIKSLGGAKLEVVFGDSQSKAINAVSEAERLITEEKVSIILGANTSSETIPMTQVAEKHQVPQLVTIPQGAAITGRGFKWIWSATLLDPDYAGGLMDALDAVRRLDPTLTKIGVIRPDNEYGIEMEKVLKEAFAKREDVTLVGIEQYSTRAQDYSPAVLKLKAAEPDIVMQVGYFRDGVILAKTYQQLDFHPVVLGTGGASGDPKLRDEIGDLVDGQIAVTPFSDDRPVVQPVLQAFKAKFDQPLTLNSALAYQGILVLRAALEKAGSRDHDAVAKAFGEIKLMGGDVITASDFIAFDEMGRNKGRNTVLTQFQDGKPVTVWPESKATAKLLLRWFNKP
ncbi:MAG: ABC transporter substrate-binding protein [Stellaceae bacterium]